MVFWTYKRHKMAPSTILIINLAIADALFLFNIPFKISGMFLKISGYKFFRQELSTGRDRNWWWSRESLKKDFLSISPKRQSCCRADAMLLVHVRQNMRNDWVSRLDVLTGDWSVQKYTRLEKSKPGKTTTKVYSILISGSNVFISNCCQF